MERLTGTRLLAQPVDHALWRSGRDYYAGGKKTFRLVGGTVDEPPRLHVYDADLLAILQRRRGAARPRWLRRPPAETISLIRKANAGHLCSLEQEAVLFLRTTRTQFDGLPIVVSWSGGKDSTVVSAIAQEAFADERVLHVFADTTIELPCTYEYMRDFRLANPAVPLLVGLPTRGFFELCREIGPPSRVQRWCCTTHKAAPLSDLFRHIGGRDKVLSVVGLRRSESLRRRGYARVIEDGKVGPQVLLSPIAEWSDFDVWAWTLSRGSPINAAYLYGLDRVGCAFCPDSREWSDMIGVAAFRDYYRPWLALIAEIGARAGVERPEEYASAGVWKSRLGGGIGATGLERTATYDIVTMPCEHDDRAVTYDLATTIPMETLGELLKIFGAVTRQGDDRVLGLFEVSGPHGSFSLKAMGPWKKVRARFDTARTRRRLEGTLRLQLRKLQACIGCGACAAICPRGAIVRVREAYRIVEQECIHCLACARGLKAGCRAAHSLNLTRGRKHA